jgi:hypothetical protein
LKERRGAAVAAVLALSFSILHDAGGWRLRRSDADVDLLRTQLVPTWPPGLTIAAHQPWRIGGRLYLNGQELMDLEGLTAADVIYRQPRPWLLISSERLNEFGAPQELRTAGYVEVSHDRTSSYRVFRPTE